jgi:Sulfotransferase domain
MALRVVGAGLGRTGTASLKTALEELLDRRCYHMYELMQRPQDGPAWASAVQGEPVDWNALLHEYAATVDWPAAAYWKQIHAWSPEALVLLSSRDSPETWWASMERTIVEALNQQPEDAEQARGREMVREMMRSTFTPEWNDRDAMIAAYERHNEEVRRVVPAGQLIEWKVGDGWEPICAGLEVPVPQNSFPHENTTADFRSSLGLDEG